jgi:serine/threonine protein kinase
MCQAELDRLTACQLPTHYTPLMPRGDDKSNDPSTRLTSLGETNAEAASSQSVDVVPSLNGFDSFGPLGRGGMGTVFLARQIALDRMVAVKFVSGDHQHSAAMISRMRSEAKIIASLKHPQIVTIHDVIDHQGTPVLILEYIDGGNLADLVHNERLHPLLACRLLELIAQGVQAAHERGVLHRDLKPSNILMDGYHPKITDFGLARSVDAQERLTSSGKMFGTPQYMAPEVIRHGSEAGSPAADVYALGVMLYELIAGAPPFAGGSTFDMLERVVREEPPPLQTRVPNVNPRIARVCEAALRKDPAQRPRSALEFSQLLHNIVEEEQRPGPIVDSDSSSAGANRRSDVVLPATTSIQAVVATNIAPAKRLNRWIGLATLAMLVVVAAAIVIQYASPPTTTNDDAATASQNEVPAQHDSAHVDNTPVVVEDSAPDDPPVSLVGTHWIGWFDFHPTDSSPDGDAELVVTSQSGNDFKGIYYSEQRNYAWNVEGEIEDDQISWEFVSAIHDNDTSSVVGVTEVRGTLGHEVITALWHQTGPTPSDADMQFGLRLGPPDTTLPTVEDP